MPLLTNCGAGFIGSALVGSALARHLVIDLGTAVLVVDALTHAADRRSVQACEPAKAFETALERRAGWCLANEGWWHRLREMRDSGERLGIGVTATWGAA